MLARNTCRAVAGAGRRCIHVTPQANAIYNSITDTIGNTPVVRLNRIVPRKDVTVYAKCE
jgi:hypothetical protein